MSEFWSSQSQSYLIFAESWSGLTSLPSKIVPQRLLHRLATATPPQDLHTNRGSSEYYPIFHHYPEDSPFRVTMIFSLRALLVLVKSTSRATELQNRLAG